MLMPLLLFMTGLPAAEVDAEFDAWVASMDLRSVCKVAKAFCAPAMSPDCKSLRRVWKSVLIWLFWPAGWVAEDCVAPCKACWKLVNALLAPERLPDCRSLPMASKFWRI